MIMELNKIYNEDCISFLSKVGERMFDVVLTSPPYNTSRGGAIFSKSGLQMSSRYHEVEGWLDNRTQEDYIDWCVQIFNALDNTLKENGVILWNVSYGADVTKNPMSISTMWLCIADIIRNTNFTVADRIIWKKDSSFPNNESPNKLTRIVEDIFVFVRKLEIRTFNCNKKVTSIRPSGKLTNAPFIL